MPVGEARRTNWIARCSSWVTRPNIFAWVLAIVLLGAYGADYALTPRGAFEFGYAPFAVRPLPYAPMRGFTYEQLWNHVARFVLLTPALLLIGFQVAAIAKRGAIVIPAGLYRAAIGISCCICALVLFGVLRGRALVDDELTYAMQSRFMLEGRIADPRLGFNPPEPFSVPTPHGYTGKYLPGEPLVQLLGVLAGVPALLHLPMLLITLVLWRRTLLARSGANIANLSVAALALSPMLIFTSATGLSHLSTLFGIVVLGYGLARCEAGASRNGALLSAFGTGFAMLCRPQSALPASAVLVPLVVVVLVKKRSISGMLTLIAAGAAIFAALLAYNAHVTGHPLRLPWFQQCMYEHYGFGPVWKTESFSHTPWTALQNLVVVAVRLNAWWLGLPASLVVLLIWIWQRSPTHGQVRWMWVGVATVLFEAGYYSPGVSDTGSIYHFELLLPGSIVAASVAQSVPQHLERRGAWAMLTVLALGTGDFMIEQVLRLQRLVTTIHADSDWALASVQRPALLVHETLGSERRMAGWIADSFPRRFRGNDDPVVTFPRVPPRLLEKVRALYPNRNCYYYHRRFDSERAELLRCEDAQPYLNRESPAAEHLPPRSLWIVPTAYKKTSYDPFSANNASHLRDANGKPLYPCCALDDARAYGDPVRPELWNNCVPEGPSWSSVLPPVK